MPAERFSGRSRRCACVLNLLAEESLEVLGQHTWCTSFDNLADLGSEANAAEAREASHAGEHYVNDEPLDVVACASGYNEMSDES